MWIKSYGINILPLPSVTKAYLILYCNIQKEAGTADQRVHVDMNCVEGFFIVQSRGTHIESFYKGVPPPSELPPFAWEYVGIH